MTTHQPLLIPLGESEGGEPTVLLPAAGGGIGPYFPLAGELLHRGPVHAIRAVGLLAGERPDRDVPTMVERYLAELRALPRPPRHLVGWSLGGVLAWELAGRLAEDGAAAPVVIMVDSYAELPARSATDHDALLDRIGRSMGHPPGEEDGGAAGEEGGAAGEEGRRLREVAAAHLEAAHAHRASAAHAGPALLISCTAERHSDQLGQWARRAPRLRVRELACTHFEALDATRAPLLHHHIDGFLTDLTQDSEG
ncbi:alpha/beta fold hydrolase [Streptomyces sp. NBC_01264]|uniref:alpha/beta fold hydrolase n=1 Tax=Streptomyces sp. NBC_01264 TaxID=2903804 RepID=UPI002250AD9B|nr:alpha/beta fold hydrolase [Streptomyces sp. NBC_01264]MCX4783056.1 alpha/beta fold hydrolase [Streptomyces sp. NBC_01264]